MGRRRRRVYERKFDWAEVRRRHAEGESMYSLAKVYGVNRSAIERVMRMPAHLIEPATDEAQAALQTLTRDQDECPRCTRAKSKGSELCRDCRNETRLDAEITLVPVPGSPREKLADVAIGRVKHRWGVVMRSGRRPKFVRVDFWDGGPEHVADTTIVAVAPSSQVLVGGVAEQPEEIAA